MADPKTPIILKVVEEKLSFTLYDSALSLHPMLKSVRDDVVAARDASQSARDTSQDHRTTAERYATENEDTTVVDADTGDDTGEYSARHHRIKAESAQSSAESAEGEAKDARDKAEQWAEEDEDTEVEDGKYSARHHRAKAEAAHSNVEAAESGALAAEQGAVDAETAAADAQSAAEDAQNAAETAESDAESHRDKAEQWAEEDEDTEVEDGKYSAYHHRAKTEAAVSDAETAKSDAESAQSAAEDAQSAAETAQSEAENAESDAESHRDKAEQWAEEDEDTEVEDGKYSARHHRAKAEAAHSNVEAAESGALAAEQGAVDAETAAADAQSAAEDAQNAAETAESDAESHRDKAEQWAEEDEDTEVEDGKYSAYHHRAKTEAAVSDAETAKSDAESAQSAAEDAQSAAETAQSEAENAESDAKSHRDDAKDHRDTSEKHRITAKRFANEAEGTTVIDEETGEDTGEYSAFHWAEKAKEEAAGGMTYRGSWDASTGEWPDDDPGIGDLYVATSEGEVDGYDVKVGEMAVYSSDDEWDLIPDTSEVTSVAGKTGEVTLNKSDVGLSNVPNTNATNADNISSGTLDDDRVPESAVTQHEEALTITESQITDLGNYIEDITDENLSDLADVNTDSVSGDDLLAYDSDSGEWTNQTAGEAGLATDSHTHDASDIDSGTLDDDRVPESAVTQHEEALTITESQISDLADYALPEGDYDDLRARATTAEDVGLSNVPNEDATDPSNWDQAGASEGDILEWDGEKWTPAAPSGGVDEEDRITMVFDKPIYRELTHQSTPGSSWEVDSDNDDIGDFAFNEDGTKMYFSSSGEHVLKGMGLEEPFEVENPDFDEPESPSLHGAFINVNGLAFNDDGTKLFVASGRDSAYPGEDPDKAKVWEFTLSSAYDTTTVEGDTMKDPTFVHDVELDWENLLGISFQDDGTRFFLGAKTSEGDVKIYQWDLDDAWDLSSLNKDSEKSINLGSGNIAFILSADGSRLFIVDIDAVVHQYDLDTDWDVTSWDEDSEQSYEDVGEDVDYGQIISFADDGKKMYVVAYFDVREFDLSTAWDVTTASLKQEESHDLSFPGAILVKNDGESAFVGQEGEIVKWGFDSSYDVSTKETSDTFKPDSKGTQPVAIEVTPNPSGDANKQVLLVGDAHADDDDAKRAVHALTLETADDITTMNYGNARLVSNSDGDYPNIIDITPFFRGGKALIWLDGDEQKLYAYETDSDNAYDLSAFEGVDKADMTIVDLDMDTDGEDAKRIFLLDDTEGDEVLLVFTDNKILEYTMTSSVPPNIYGGDEIADKGTLASGGVYIVDSRRHMYVLDSEYDRIKKFNLSFVR